MLIEFSVNNYRSFADEQRLSLSAGRFRSDRRGAIQNTPAKASPHILRVAAILGANGSGKSNLIRALGFMQHFVAVSAQSMQKGDKINVEPFRLGNGHETRPSLFDLSFLYKNTEYSYSFAVNKDIILSECLLSRSENKPLREIFSRSIVDGEQIWNLGSLPKSQARLWRQSTRPNALFLSTAVQLNSEELSDPFDWITRILRVQGANDPFSQSHTSHLIKDHVKDGCRLAILNLLREADLGIRDVIVKEEDFSESKLPEVISDEFRRSLTEQMKDRKFLSASFSHRSQNGEDVAFDYEDESEGTQRLYAMAGPWISSLRHNYTLVIDEIENSLHPYIVRMLISMFQSPEDERSTAQLIFSSHSDGILDGSVLERDQFWFVEKRRGQSKLFPLNEFKPRKGEAIRTNYLKGRYGGVPAISHVER